MRRAFGLSSSRSEPGINLLRPAARHAIQLRITQARDNCMNPDELKRRLTRRVFY